MVQRIKEIKHHTWRTAFINLSEYGLIITTMFFSFFLSLLPPLFFYPYQQTPDFVLITLVYWALTTPYYHLTGLLFVIGISKDILSNNILCLHVLLYFLIHCFFRRSSALLKMMPFFLLWCFIPVIIAIIEFLFFIIFHIFYPNFQIHESFIEHLFSFFIFYPLMHFSLNWFHKQMITLTGFIFYVLQK